jgi:hypothetical protein
MNTKLQSRPAEQTAARPSRERMTTVLDALSYGLQPAAYCQACQVSPGGRCPECARAIAGSKAVSAAITAVENAPTGEQALTAYTACLLWLVEEASD